MDFLTRLLPSTGLYCSARTHTGSGFIHVLHPSLTEALSHARAMDAAGHTMYLAQATFSMEAYQNWQYNNSLPTGHSKADRKTIRTQKLAVALRSFFVDIDCGPEKFARDPEKSYPTQMEATRDLRRFCQEASFPFPALVSSGHGLYAHWLIDQDVPAAQWKTLADVFKQVLAAYSFKQDPSRTADSASVLRPVGVHNRKTGEIKDVKLLVDAEAITLDRFAQALTKAAAVKKIKAMALEPPTRFTGVNDEFTAGIGGPPASAHRVADKCAQIRQVRDRRGDVAEPVWYAAIGLLRYCEEGEELVHEWSKGHPGYSVEATADKIQHHIDSGSGPTSCQKFGMENPGPCMGCPSANKVKSPIVLGREIEIAAAVTEEEADLVPHGFTRSETGVYYTADEGAPQRIYPYDLYPIRVAHDRSLGYETVTIRHRMPITGEYQEFTVRSALLHDPKTFLMTMADNHVQVTGTNERKHMMAYADTYMAKLRSLKSLSTLHCQMGWRADGLDQAFVLGEQTYRIDGTEEETGYARNIPEVAKAFHAVGEKEEWAAATKILGLPGMEPFAFAFMAGAFGAPLMRFTGYAGAVVALVGHTGIGKTLVGEWILSTYGDPRQLSLLKNDTVNALVSRLGLYGSLPLYLDEVSNIEGQELSDLLYRVTQGRDKARLGRDSREKSVLNSWSTVAIASSNHSLVDKLATLKSDASAEVNRILEVFCRPVAGFGRAEATRCYRTFHENYGSAGPAYIRHIVENQTGHRDNIDALSKKIDAMSEAGSDERFWSAMSATAVYGGLIAKKLGLIEFEVAPVLKWLVGRIKEPRSDKEEPSATQVDVLGQFLDEMAPGVMVTSGDESKLCTILREPRGPLVARIMTDKNLLYVSRKALAKYLEKHFASYTELKGELTEIGALKQSNIRRVLGVGTYIGGTQQPCWLIDLNCPALGRKVLTTVTEIQGSKSRITAVGLK